MSNLPIYNTVLVWISKVWSNDLKIIRFHKFMTSPFILRYTLRSNIRKIGNKMISFPMHHVNKLTNYSRISARNNLWKSKVFIESGYNTIIMVLMIKTYRKDIMLMHLVHSTSVISPLSPNITQSMPWTHPIFLFKYIIFTCLHDRKYNVEKLYFSALFN